MKQRGFTLIELIIVIIILGILAVTAAPRFMGMQSDAIESTLNGVRGALESGASLVYAKAAIQNEHRVAAGTTDVSSTGTAVNVNTRFGYPDVRSGTTPAMVQSWVDIDLGTASTANNDFFVTFDTSAGTMTIQPTGNQTATNCNVVYTRAADANSSPNIVVTATGC